MSEPGTWLLFLAQGPPAPSSLRVQVWRRMRAAGALALLPSVWLLPRTPMHEAELGILRAYVEEHGGTSWILTIAPLAPPGDAAWVARFQAERDEEYHEFVDRCAGLQAELAKATTAGNFTFAELEENEQDLHKLETWLARIQERDAFGGAEAPAAAAALAAGQVALAVFARHVYAQAGLRPLDDEVAPGTPNGTTGG